MCGIAAAFSYRADAPPIGQNEIVRMRDFMIARGPDGAGLWVHDKGHVGFGFRRLAIIDPTDLAMQPMATADGRYRIIFNGEIYNYRELRALLTQRGYQFRSRGDTEVVLLGWQEFGEGLFSRLRGMFALAVWDEHRRGLILARDHFGIKPLYYHDDGRAVRVASQVKALLAGGAVRSDPNPAGHVGFYLWGSVPDPYTLYRGIFAVPAGHSIWIDEAGPHAPKTFFDITQSLTSVQSRGGPAPNAQTISEAIRDSVRHHLIADVPVGLFLSSGVDSSTIAAVASEEKPDIRAITLGFSEFANRPEDEVPLAAMVANRYGYDHRIARASAEEFNAELSNILSAMDQPSIDGVNTYFVAKAAAQNNLKVALSGLGGDEWFGGYPGVRRIPALVSGLRVLASVPGLGKGLRHLAAPVVGRITSPKYAALAEYAGSYGGAYLLRRGIFLPWELEDILDRDFLREGLDALRPVQTLNETIAGLKSKHCRVAVMETTHYMRNTLLRDADWAGMAHSVEIRVPLVDIGLFDAIAPLLAGPNPPTKSQLAQSLTKPLPDEVLRRPKSGFSIPIQQWAAARAAPTQRRGIRDWAIQIGPDIKAKRLNTPRRAHVTALMTDAFGGRGGIAKFNRDLLWALASLDDVVDIYCLPRHVVDRDIAMPPKIRMERAASLGKMHFLIETIQQILQRRRIDTIICGHLNLLPLAWALATMKGARLYCVIHGVEAWGRHRSATVRHFIRSVDAFVSVSRLTAERFAKWSGTELSKIAIVPNSFDRQLFWPGDKPQYLIDRYGLGGRTVLLTMGRLAGRERYKGFDEVLDVVPSLREKIDNVSYLIVGDGDDRSRLEAKARALGIADRVIFAGYIPEHEKADHYRISDVYVMPSKGEGFGIVLLEAMACGIPTIASRLDGSREAMLDGKLGRIVDPDDPAALAEAITSAVASGRGIPAGLDYYSLAAFRDRVHALPQRADAERTYPEQPS
jgi:asparagine synthase (glutamine-hydrolysing)